MSASASSPLNNSFDWDLIRETVEDQKCILFIGPKVYGNDKAGSLNQRIANYLEAPTNPNIKAYYEKDALFLFKDPPSKTKALINIKRFLEEENFDPVRSLYEKIAQIPFHVIVSLTPDTLLSDTFNQQNINHKFDYYRMNRPSKDNPLTPSKQTPLVYNLFGFINQKDSLILTHDDLFDYFNSILGGIGLHPDLKQLIKRAENFIFLGVSFDKWYMQLLLKMLYNLHEKDEFLRYSSDHAFEEEVRTICEDQFRIEFVPEKMDAFIDELYKQFPDTELRGKEQERVSIGRQLKELISEGKTVEAINSIRVHLEQALDSLDQLQGDTLDLVNDFLNESTQLKSQFTRLKRRINSNVISDDKAEVRMNQITQALLDLIDEVSETLKSI
jgi:hypothetical protein